MTLNARQIAFQRQPHEGLDHIKYLSEPVGSGKTAAVINDIRDNQNENYIFVSPTRNLAREIKNRLDNKLRNHGQGENVHLIITEDDEPQVYSVRRRILNKITERTPEDFHTLVITTEAFRSVLPEIGDEHKSEYNIFLDEGIDVIESVSLATRNQAQFMEHITINEDDSFSISVGSGELLRAVVRNPGQLSRLGREELATPNFRMLAKLLVNNIYDIYGGVGDSSIRAIAFLRPDSFLPFKSVTMIVAIFNQSLLALFWREKYGIDFRPYETDHELFDTHSVKGPRMRIHYLLHPDDGASRLNLERNWQTGERGASEDGGERVIDRAAVAIRERFGHAPYCWAANEFFANYERVLSDPRMPTKCAGLDIFRHHDVVVSMVCINPMPWVKNMVTQHVGIGDNELYELWRLSYTYQTIGRCSIRKRDSSEWIDVVVISSDCADRINEIFVGSEIVGQLTDLPSYSAMQQRRGPAKKRNPFSRSDTAAWIRYCTKNPDQGLSPEEWYRDFRVAYLERKNS